jgi:hypothetical protein
MTVHKTTFPKLNINAARRALVAGDNEPLIRFFDVLPVRAAGFQSAPKTSKKIQKLPSQSPSYFVKGNVKKTFLTPTIEHLLCHFHLLSIFTTINSNYFKAFSAAELHSTKTVLSYRS